IHVKAPTLIVKIAAHVAQILDRPAGYLFCQNHRARNAAAQIYQGNDCSRCGVNIDRIESIGKILRPTILKKESLAPEIVTTTQGTLQLFTHPSRYRRWDSIIDPRQTR